MIRSRKIEEKDFPQMEKEIRADQCHVEWLKPDFFLEPNTLSLVYEDSDGPILYLRMSSSVRMHIQFCNVDKQRIRDCINSQFPLIAASAKSKGYKEIIYESFSKPLIYFCRKFGFHSSKDEQVMWLTSKPATPITSDVCAAAHLSQNKV